MSVINYELGLAQSSVGAVRRVPREERMRMSAAERLRHVVEFQAEFDFNAYQAGLPEERRLSQNELAYKLHEGLANAVADVEVAEGRDVAAMILAPYRPNWYENHQ